MEKLSPEEVWKVLDLNPEWQVLPDSLRYPIRGKITKDLGKYFDTRGEEALSWVMSWLGNEFAKVFWSETEWFKQWAALFRMARVFADKKMTGESCFNALLVKSGAEDYV
jgi:hypothetical protein